MIKQRIIETPIYYTIYQLKLDENNEPLLTEDGSFIQEPIDILQHTIIETYNDTIEIIDDFETIVNSELIEKKRLMPNGDVYIIQDNVELYIPINPEPKTYTESEKLWDAISYLLLN